MSECVGLAEALDLDIRISDYISIRKPIVSTYITKGIVQSLKERIKENHIELVVINTTLSPAQLHNLEKSWQVKVIDRTGIILEIFSLRAHTREGRLQVELARLDYERSHLVRTWTHLERQKGGSGFISGPGETQIETDRRLIRQKIVRLNKELKEVRRTRELHRKNRRQTPFPILALAGYTNAGKSMLFNRLTQEKVLVKDMPFATLDPVMRKIRTKKNREVILLDTVGFISELPTHLIAAFRATLEEVVEADILLHIRDISTRDTDSRKQDVDIVLEELKAGVKFNQDTIEVWNKADLLKEEAHQCYKKRLESQGNVVLISARTGEGTETLLEKIEELLSRHEKSFSISIPVTLTKARSWLYRFGQIIQENNDSDNRVNLIVSLTQIRKGQFLSLFPEAQINMRTTEVI